MLENSIITDKIKGVIYGQAIGDALGLATEFLTKEQVKEDYPNGIKNYSDIIQDKHRKRWKIGDWTDDTDQMLCILDSILEIKKVDEKHIAENLMKWFREDPMGIGSTVLKVLNIPQYASNPPKAAETVWKMGGRKNAANGAIMRTSILGV